MAVHDVPVSGDGGVLRGVSCLHVCVSVYYITEAGVGVLRTHQHQSRRVY